MPDSTPDSATSLVRDAAPRRVLIISNPAAGGAAKRRLDAVGAELRALGNDVVFHRTVMAGDAATVAAATDGSDVDVVVAAGGDGTVHEVLNGLARNPGPAPALAVMPLGTANVLAAELDMPRRAKDLARVFAGGPVRPVRFGLIHRSDGQATLFANMAGAGFDARCVATVSLGLKRRIGGGAYGFAALGQLCRSQSRLRTRIDGVEHDVASLVVTKVRTYAGPYLLAPSARLEDGRLHVCLFERSGPAATLAYSLSLMRNRLGRCAGFAVRTAEKIELVEPVGDVLQADGDIVAALPVSIGLRRDPIDVVVPPGRAPA